MARSYKSALLVAMTLLLFGCSSSNRVVVDQSRVDQAQYQRDMQECKQVAAQVSVGGDAASGAARGAVFGAMLGAIFGNSSTVRRSAGGGAVVGGAGGTRDAERERNRVMKNCMRSRGYQVLN